MPSASRRAVALASDHGTLRRRHGDAEFTTPSNLLSALRPELEEKRHQTLKGNHHECDAPTLPPLPHR
jgi:hypothetical protein